MVLNSTARAVGPYRRGRPIGGVTLGRTRFHPLRDQRDLRLAQPARADNGEFAALRQPWRHAALARDVGNLAGALDRVRVCQKRERRRFAGPVAGRAVRVDDRRDVPIEGNLRMRRRSPAACGGSQRPDDRSSERATTRHRSVGYLTAVGGRLAAAFRSRSWFAGQRRKEHPRNPRYPRRYSVRSARIGSIRLARWAGIRPAAAETSDSKATVMMAIAGSRGSIP